MPRRHAPPDEAASSSNFVVWAALVGNVLVAASKFVAAALSGSAAMLAEGIHSLVDTGNEVLLLYGMRQSHKKPEPDFPFGHGREIYFWSFIVALLIFTLGAGVTTWEGVHRIRHPEAIERPGLVYAVLGLSALFEGTSWLISLRAVRRAIGADESLLAGIRRSKDPPTFMVLVEDSAALAGIAIAALGTWLAVTLDDPRYDGAASILIGVLLAVVAIALGVKTKSLLIGERADPALVKEVLAAIDDFDGVENANGMLTAHLSPDQIIAIASVAFRDDLRVPQVEKLVAEIERDVVGRYPEIGSLFVKPQTPAAYRAARHRRFTDGVAPKAAVAQE